MARVVRMSPLNVAPILITAEELIVYAASRGLAPPSGVLPVLASLDQSDSRQAILDYAARVLVTRGVVGDENDETPAPDIDAVLHLMCAPRARVVIGASDGDITAYQAFSIDADHCVIQAWDALNLHGILTRPSSEALIAIQAASRLDLIGATTSHADFTLSRESVETAVGAGRDDVERLVSDQLTDVAAASSLVDALLGRGPGTSVMAERDDGGEGWADAFGWFGPGPDGAWLIRTSLLPGPEVDGADLLVKRVGRTEIEGILADITATLTGGATSSQ